MKNKTVSFRMNEEIHDKFKRFSYKKLGQSLAESAEDAFLLTILAYECLLTQQEKEADNPVEIIRTKLIEYKNKREKND
jgi:hypothetical protein